MSEPSNPWVSGAASLFTEEFYQRISGYLTEKGLFVQWIQMYEFNPRLLASITGALGPVWKNYVAYHNYTDLLIVASKSQMLGAPQPAPFDMHPLADELQALGISNLRDLETRRLANKPTINRILFWEAAPDNSDYFPFVDVEAARARFKSQQTDHIMALGDAPIPVVELIERWEPIGQHTGQPPAGRPRAPAGSVRRGSHHRISAEGRARRRSAAPPGCRAAARAGRVQLPFWWTVSKHPTQAPFRDEVLRLAIYLNRWAPAATLESMWKTAANSPCLARLPRHYRDWIGLFHSVGIRDAAGIVRSAVPLLDVHDKTPAQIEYLVLAIATGQFRTRRCHQRPGGTQRRDSGPRTGAQGLALVRVPAAPVRRTVATAASRSDRPSRTFDSDWLQSARAIRHG